MLCVRETGGNEGKRKENNTDMLCHAKAIKRDAAFFLNHSGVQSTIFSEAGECKQRLWLEPDLKSSP